jgi:CMP/dCMP kinase
LKFKNKIIQISCDGGAATGKSTGAKMIAKKYRLKFLSSGLLYRYASYLLIKKKPVNTINFLKKNFKNFNLNKLNKINLHTQEISNQSALIAKTYKIRKILKTVQLDFAKKFKNCCIEGRDISTKILPNSDIKFYFKCNINVASIRRYNELKKNNNKIELNEVKKALRIRNNHDTKRKNSPLLKHIDAIEIDTGKLNKQAMLKKMSKYVDKMIKAKYGN